MAKSTRPREIDGLSSVRAAERSSKITTTPKLQPSRTRLQGKKEDTPSAGPDPARKIGHTVIPDKFNIICYDCNYAFSMTGKLRDTHCPKCRVKLMAEDIELTDPPPARTKTIGTVFVRNDIKLGNSSIVTRDLVLESKISEGKVEVKNMLILEQSARFSPRTVIATDISVRKGAAVKIIGDLSCRNILIEGIIEADINTTGTATIKPGGYLKGKLSGEHLILEDGGGISADVILEQRRNNNVN